MKNILTLLLFSISGITLLHAQSEETLFNKNRGIRLTGIWGATNHSLADFENDFNLNTGGYFAFEINKNLLIGWAGYDSDLTSEGRNIELSGSDLLLGYQFNSHNVIHPVFYLQGGSSKLQIEDAGSDRVFVVQPSIGAEINIARFFRLGIDGGYRFFNNTDLPGFSDKDFSGPILGLRLKFGWSWGR